MSTDRPFLSIIIPTLNEERYLDACVRSLLDDYPRDRLEILVLDGGSSDRTVEIAEHLGAEMPFLRVLENPARLQAAAFNLAMRKADPRSTVLLRCDAHARYSAGFATRAVNTLQQTGAALVAFTGKAEAKGVFQAAVAFAQSTPLGVGGSRYRLGNFSGWVDHGWHGCFSREAVEAADGYDESFSHNEDSELSLRLRRAGGGVWLDGELLATYFPRESVRALARQFFFYGRGRASTCLKLGVRPAPRQLLPPLLVTWHSLLALPLSRRRGRRLAPIAAYAAALWSFAALEAIRRRDRKLLLAPIALATMHHAWGAGFLSRLLQARGGVATNAAAHRDRQA